MSTPGAAIAAAGAAKQTAGYVLTSDQTEHVWLKLTIGHPGVANGETLRDRYMCLCSQAKPEQALESVSHVMRFFLRAEWDNPKHVPDAWKAGHGNSLLRGHGVDPRRLQPWATSMPSTRHSAQCVGLMTWRFDRI